MKNKKLHKKPDKIAEFTTKELVFITIVLLLHLGVGIALVLLFIYLCSQI